MTKTEIIQALRNDYTDCMHRSSSLDDALSDDEYLEGVLDGRARGMFFCEMCGSGDCCERTDIHGGPILCDTCYTEAKQDQEDKDAIEEIFKDN